MGSLPPSVPLQKLHSVAIVGFGISGVVSALHLKAAGLSVTVYERSSQAGGIWLYDSRLPIEPRYPATKPSLADVDVWSDEDFDAREGERRARGNDCDNDDEEGKWYDEDVERKRLRHAPPGPAYVGLKNNVPTTLMELKGLPWDSGTPEYVSHAIIVEYIQSIAREKDLVNDVLYDTKVEHMWKEKDRWHVQFTTLIEAENSTARKVQSIREFDAVVVANGHYHAPKVPDIPGLREWKQRWPTKVLHSKSYRDPEDYRNQNVLLIGAGTSSTDIARELHPLASQVYQSSRGGPFDLSATLLPANARRVGEIASFSIPCPTSEQAPSLDTASSPTIGTAILRDGSTIEDIHRVIVATGYQHTLPFLPTHHNDNLTSNAADSTVLVTDGTQVHNLHKDIFYIPDPTLCFIGLPYYSATFTLFEFQAIALAAVFAGRATLPTQDEMRREYDGKVEKKGYGRAFHSVRGKEIEYVDELVGWVNREADRVGANRVEGHTEKWRAARQVFEVRLKERGLRG